MALSKVRGEGALIQDTYRGESLDKKLQRIAFWADVPRGARCLFLGSREGGDASTLLGMGHKTEDLFAAEICEEAAYCFGKKFPDIRLYKGDVRNYNISNLTAIYLDFCSPLCSDVYDCVVDMLPKCLDQSILAVNVLKGRDPQTVVLGHEANRWLIETQRDMTGKDIPEQEIRDLHEPIWLRLNAFQMATAMGRRKHRAMLKVIPFKCIEYCGTSPFLTLSFLVRKLGPSSIKMYESWVWQQVYSTEYAHWDNRSNRTPRVTPGDLLQIVDLMPNITDPALVLNISKTRLAAWKACRSRGDSLFQPRNIFKVNHEKPVRI